MGEVARPRHIPALDGLRGVAVLAVLAYHFMPSRIVGGYLGVSVFFTLSGFLITRLVVDELAQTGSLNLWRFYDRRFRRLIPAASLVIIAVVVATTLDNGPATIDRGDAFAAVFWHYNWHELGQAFVYGGDVPSALGHYWSLAIEEQFYLVYPALVFLAFRLGGRRGATGMVALLVVIGLVAHVGIDNYFNSFARMGEIAAGALLALSGFVIGRAGVGRAVSMAALAVIVGLCLAVRLPVGNDLPNAAIIACTIATLVVISAAEHQRLLSATPLRVLGTYSYSLYLWHWPVLVFVDGWPLQIALTIALSLASYHLVEAPARLVGGRIHETGARTRPDTAVDGRSSPRGPHPGSGVVDERPVTAPRDGRGGPDESAASNPTYC